MLIGSWGNGALLSYKWFSQRQNRQYETRWGLSGPVHINGGEILEKKVENNKFDQFTRDTPGKKGEK